MKKKKRKKTGRRTLSDRNRLSTNFPEISKQWHPDKNTLTADQVSYASHLKAWWLCPTCGHEWEAMVSSRTRYGDKASCPGGNGCNVTDRNRLSIHLQKLRKYFTSTFGFFKEEDWV
ncbi:MAG: zinc-ribbon domain-containing protein [Candidatus Hodarchaeota archaeon]